MRLDAAAVLTSMGYEVDRDFIATQDGPASCSITWLSQQPQPSEAEIDAAAASATVNLLNIDHAKLVALLSGDGPNNVKVLRALLLVALDEFNQHATKINAILTAIDSGSTLAQVKTNIAAIADYPVRTKANLVAAMTAKINAGDADT